MMNATTGFDIALHVNPTELAEVRVAPRNYHLDSLQNRKDYEKIFNYTKPGLGNYRWFQRFGRRDLTSTR